MILNPDDLALHAMTTIVEAGIAASAKGEADWCPSCDTLRYRGDMRWLFDVYACRACLGPGVGEPALWVDPWDWGSSVTLRG